MSRGRVIVDNVGKLGVSSNPSLDGLGRDGDAHGSAQLDQRRGLAAARLVHSEAYGHVHAARFSPHAVRD